MAYRCYHLVFKISCKANKLLFPDSFFALLPNEIRQEVAAQVKDKPFSSKSNESEVCAMCKPFKCFFNSHIYILVPLCVRVIDCAHSGDEKNGMSSFVVFFQLSIRSYFACRTYFSRCVGQCHGWFFFRSSSSSSSVLAG